MRRIAPHISIGLGLLVAIVAVLAAISVSTVGDVDSIESSLVAGANWRGTSDDSPDVATTTREDSLQNPLWSVNPDSRLGRELVIVPQPVSIAIEALDVVAPVIPYGIDADSGQMAVPRSVSEVAWYRYGPAPGQPGSAVLAAHVDLKSQGPGVFFNLGQLNPGDTIVIGFDTGATREFVVEARTIYTKEDLPARSIFSKEGPSILTLITCGGGFNEAEEHYDSNVVVYAVPADSALPGAGFP